MKIPPYKLDIWDAEAPGRDYNDKWLAQLEAVAEAAYLYTLDRTSLAYKKKQDLQYALRELYDMGEDG